MWSKRLLRTIRPSSEPPTIPGQCLLLLLLIVTVVSVIAGGAEARSLDSSSSDDATNNNERDSATALIQFRSDLKRIVYGSRDSSLTLVLSEGSSKDSVNLRSVVHGLRFHVVESPLLCDEDLPQQSQWTVEILNERNVLVSDENTRRARRPVVEYVCAVWPVEAGGGGIVGGNENDENHELEWLSANGIERRSAVEGGEHRQILLMHLGHRIEEIKR